MPTKLDVPRRTDPLVDKDLSPTKRVHAFFESIPQIADTQSSLDITWTSNQPASSTAMVIANGSSITAAETAQAIENLNSQINALIAELKSAGVIKD